MTMTIDRYTRRAKQTLQADGLMDIACGIGLFALALIHYTGIQMVAAARQGASGSTNNAFLVAIIAANTLIVLGFAVVEPLKRRFVYPRLGYAQPRVIPQERRLRPVISLGIVAVTVLVTQIGFRNPGKPASFWSSDEGIVCLGIVLATALTINFFKVGYMRHLLIAGVSVLAALLVALLPLDAQHASLWFSLILGTSLLISGGITFAALLRTPLLTEDDTEDDAE